MRPSLVSVFATVLLLACSSRASVDSDLATIYSVAPAKLALEHESELAKRVESILRKQSRYLIAQFHPWEHDRRALLLTAARSNEAGIRPNAHAAYGLAVMARTLNDTDARDKSIAILRFLLSTHGAGAMQCADGKQWRDQWQSALWAESAGRAAWLLWDDLDPQMRWLAARMTCDEAERFVDAEPPAQIENDTKAEENAWNSTVLALAHCMFPQHPNHALFGQAAIRWQISALAVAKDVGSAQVVEGKPLNQWLTAPNLHDDYTLENHRIVHPDYMTTIRALFGQKLTYDLAGIRAPESIYFNVRPVYANLKKLSTPDGGWVYPSGQDRHLHRNADWFATHAGMAVLFDDPQAAALMRLCLDTAEKMIARSATGGIYADGETFFASSQAALLELFADAYLVLRSHGEGAPPVPEAQLWRGLSGTHIFEAAKFAVVRSEHSIATFSWGRQVMGMVLPLRRDLLLTPNERSLIGDLVTADGKRDQPRVIHSRITEANGGFAITGILNRAGGAIEQRFAFITLPDGRTIYVDHFNGSARLARADLGLLGVLNDINWVHHTGRRRLDFAGGQHVFTQVGQSRELSSPWYHFDGLGIACLESSGRQVYHATPSPIRARTEQRFVLNAIDPARIDGAQTALVCFPSANEGAIAEHAGKCELIQSSPRHLAITLDDGHMVRIDLDRLTVAQDTP